MQRVYSSESYAPGKHLSLTESEAHHVLKVLRLSVGEEIELFDGRGTLAIAIIKEASKKTCTVEVISTKTVTNTAQVSIAFAIPKGQALDFIIHRCTEIGVREFIPLVTEHSLHPSSWNRERWGKVLVEVSKQCQSPYLPSLHEPLGLSEWLKKRSADHELLFCDEEQRAEKSLTIKPSKPIDVLVGAEGGWSQVERTAVAASGAKFLSLGSNRLRAETAAVVALTLAKKLLGEI